MSVNACVCERVCACTYTWMPKVHGKGLRQPALHFYICLCIYEREKEGESTTMCDMQLRRLFHHVGVGDRQAPEPPDLDNPWMRLPSQVIADYADS